MQFEIFSDPAVYVAGFIITFFLFAIFVCVVKLEEEQDKKKQYEMLEELVDIKEEKAGNGVGSPNMVKQKTIR